MIILEKNEYNATEKFRIYKSIYNHLKTLKFTYPTKKISEQ